MGGASWNSFNKMRLFHDYEVTDTHKGEQSGNPGVSRWPRKTTRPALNFALQGKNKHSPVLITIVQDLSL